MIYKDVEVKIPKHIRMKEQNGSRYVYLVTGRKGDRRGHAKDRTVNIGKQSREGYMNPNGKYFEHFPEDRGLVETAAAPQFDTQSRIGAVAAIGRIAEETGLKQCLGLAFGSDAGLILSLAGYYLVARDSAAMLYSDFMFDHYGIEGKIASQASISRLFNRSMDRGKVDAFRSAFLKHCFSGRGAGKKRRVYVDIDSTNINVSSSGCGYAEYGKPKDDEGLPQINRAYFHDRESGMPIFYDSFYGSVTDLSHCISGIKAFFDNLNIRGKDVRYDFVLDRGYFSEKNITYITANKISFAVMGKSCDVYRGYLESYRSRIKSSRSLISVGSYGTVVKGKAFKGEDTPDYFIYLYFDSAKEREEKSGIEARVVGARKALEGKKKDRGGNLRRTYGKYLSIETKADGETIKKVSVNSAGVDAMLKDAGYFWIVSTRERTPEERLKAYRDRDDIEKCFRMVKSESDLDKTYAQNDGVLYAKVMMGFVTAVLRAEMTCRTRGLSRRANGMSVQKRLLALDKIIMYRVNGHYSLKYAYTSLQREIMNALGVSEGDIESVIDAWNSKPGH